jgi:hypothetical protein
MKYPALNYPALRAFEDLPQALYACSLLCCNLLYQHCALVCNLINTWSVVRVYVGSVSAVCLVPEYHHCGGCMVSEDHHCGGCMVSEDHHCCGCMVSEDHHCCGCMVSEDHHC